MGGTRSSRRRRGEQAQSEDISEKKGSQTSDDEKEEDSEPRTITKSRKQASQRKSRKHDKDESGTEEEEEETGRPASSHSRKSNRSKRSSKTDDNVDNDTPANSSRSKPAKKQSGNNNRDKKEEAQTVKRQRRHTEPVLTAKRSNFSDLPITKVLDASFLKRPSSKKDLIHRFRHVWHRLMELNSSTEDVDPREEWPNAGGLALYLVETSLMDRQDSGVRLWASVLCLELLALFAPDIPWESPDTKRVFTEACHQVAALTTSCSKNRLHHQFLERIVFLFAQLQMGALLVEMVGDEEEEAYDKEFYESQKQQDGGDEDAIVSSSSSEKEEDENDDDNNNKSTRQHKHSFSEPAPMTAKELIALFVSNMLQAVHAGDDFANHIVHAVSAILAEYTDDSANVPVAILDELLLALVPGPQVSMPKYSSTKRTAPPVWKDVRNPVFHVTLQILHHNVATVQKAVSTLVRTLLSKAYHGGGGDGSARIEELSNIDTEPPEAEQDKRSTNHDKSIFSIVPLVYQISVLPSADQSSRALQHSLLDTSVFSVLQEGLQHGDEKTRRATCVAVAECLKHSKDRNEMDSLLLLPWLKRHKDAVVDIRRIVARHTATLVRYKVQATVSPSNEEEATIQKLVEAIEDLLEDSQKPVRVASSHALCQEFLGYFAKNINSDGANSRHCRETCNRLLHTLLDLDVPQAERRETLECLIRVWAKASWGSLSSMLSSSDPSLFASLLKQQLQACERNSTVGSARKKTKKNEIEPLFVEWLLPRLFQTASAQQQNHNSSQKRSAASSSGDLMRLLEAQLGKSWEKYVASTENTNIQIAAAMLMWHTLPYQAGLSWGNPRARLQLELSKYLQLREQALNAEKDSEEAFDADAKAMDTLQRIDHLLSPAANASQDEVESRNEMLAAFHKTRDKQVFRILASIATPTHSPSAKERALEQVPSRLRAFVKDGGVVDFVVDLVEQTSMPPFSNAAVLKGILGLVSNPQIRVPALKIVNMLTGSFGKLAGPAWEPLCSLLEAKANARKKRKTARDSDSEEDNEDGEVEEDHQKHSEDISEESLDLITSILATAAPHAKEDITPPDRLVDLCRYGTLKQARNAVKALTGFSNKFNEAQYEDDSPYSPLSLMDTLSPELSLSKTQHTLTVLASLTALVQSAPRHVELMESASHEAWQFCLKAIQKNVDRASSGSPKRKRSRSPAASRQSGVVCAALDFLSCFLRSYLLVSPSAKQKRFITEKQKDIRVIFRRLVELLQSTSAAEDVRECAAVHFCRLCDSRIKLEQTYVTFEGWHTLCKVLQENSPVQEALSNEFEKFLVGGGVFGDEDTEGVALKAVAPSLRISSLHIFVQTKKYKSTATQSMGLLRDACNNCFAQCTALGKVQLSKFENEYRFGLMPEYIVPYAFNLLVANTQKDEERILRKRLKALFEPLILSLGEAADNLGFLLQLSQHLGGGNYKPILPEQFQEDDADEILPFVCKVARDVLINLVKKDVNLSPEVGQIRIPVSLFVRCGATKRPLSQSSGDDSLFKQQEEEEDSEKESPVRASSIKKSSSRNRTPATSRSKKSQGHVQFSPAPPSVLHLSTTQVSQPLSAEKSFGDLSPIAKEGGSPLDSSSQKTMGSTPPELLTHIKSTGPTQNASTAGTPASGLGSGSGSSLSSGSRTKRRRRIPTQIRLNHSSASSKKSNFGDDLEFAFGDENALENTPNNKRTRKRSRV